MVLDGKGLVDQGKEIIVCRARHTNLCRSRAGFEQGFGFMQEDPRKTPALTALEVTHRPGLVGGREGSHPLFHGPLGATEPGPCGSWGGQEMGVCLDEQES